jgi:hypothetical protein
MMFLSMIAQLIEREMNGPRIIALTMMTIQVH